MVRVTNELFGPRGAWIPVVQLWQDDHLFEWELRLFVEEGREIRTLHTQIDRFVNMIRQQRCTTMGWNRLLMRSDIAHAQTVFEILYRYFCHLTATTKLPWYDNQLAKEICWSCEDIRAMVGGASPSVGLDRRHAAAQPAKRVEGAGKRKEDKADEGAGKKRS